MRHEASRRSSWRGWSRFVARGLAVAVLAGTCTVAAAGGASAEASAAQPRSSSADTVSDTASVSPSGARRRERPPARRSARSCRSTTRARSSGRSRTRTCASGWPRDRGSRSARARRSPSRTRADGSCTSPAASTRSTGNGRVGSTQLRLPVVVEPGSAPVQLGGTKYHGTLRISVVAGKLEAINTLALDDYVVDVVSSECPGYWRQDALRAQAVASRSYALTSTRPQASFDLYPDDRSQNYHGMVQRVSDRRRRRRGDEAPGSLLQRPSGEGVSSPRRTAVARAASRTSGTPKRCRTSSRARTRSTRRAPTATGGPSR